MAGMFKSGPSNLIRSGDSSEAGAQLVEALGACDAVFPEDVAAFDMELECTAFERAAFLFWRFQTAAGLATAFDRHLICSAVQGRVVIDTGAAEIAIAESTAAILPPNMAYRLRWDAGAILAGILVDEREVQRSLAADPESATGRLGGFRCFDMNAHAGGVYAELMEFLLADRLSARASRETRSGRQLFDQLIIYGAVRLCTGQSPNLNGAARNSLVPRHIKLAEDYIKAHLSEPLDSIALAAVAEVSSRSLYRGFVHFRGVTPARYILDLRLEAVHKVLTSSSNLRDIQEIAASIGFRSYPAFWRSYVRKYGIAPSKTKTMRDGGG